MMFTIWVIRFAPEAGPPSAQGQSLEMISSRLNILPRLRSSSVRSACSLYGKKNSLPSQDAARRSNCGNDILTCAMNLPRIWPEISIRRSSHPTNSRIGEWHARPIIGLVVNIINP
jgi:hypothetical protein